MTRFALTISIAIVGYFAIVGLQNLAGMFS